MAVDMYESLTARADAAARDIAAEFPEIDVSYDLYIEELRNERGNREWFGMIDMGEAYQAAFTWDGRAWQEYFWCQAYEIKGRILRHREFQNRHAGR